MNTLPCITVCIIDLQDRKCYRYFTTLEVALNYMQRNLFAFKKFKKITFSHGEQSDRIIWKC